MWKKTLILTIVCVFALALVSIAGDRMPAKEDLQEMFDRNLDVFIDRGEQNALQREQNALQKFLEIRAHSEKLQELKGRIEKLRSMAREAEEKAKHFRAEAEELERTLKREMEHRDKAKHIDEMHAQLAELKEAEVGKLHEVEKRIVQLQEMARQAKQRGEMDKAELLWAEAKELEQALKREMEHRDKAKHIKEMHAKLAGLKEAIEHAKREGQHDKADELRKKAERIANEIMAHQREAQEKKLHEAEKRVVHLQEMASQAKQRGEMDKAERLWAEAKELKGALKREIEHREKAKHMEEMHAELVELKEAAEHAKREGWHDKADALRKKAEQLAGKIAMTAQQGKGHIKKNIEQLHAMAKKAKEAGYHEKAEALLQKAKNLGRHLRDVAEGDKEKAHKKDLERLVEELRNEVKGLRQEVEKLKQSRQGRE